MIARIAVATLALGVAGCTVTEQVLGDDTSPITTCAAVWDRGFPGASCSLTSQCVRDDPSDPMCCQAYAYCRMGELVMGTTCNPDCSSCIDDLSCTFGAATCDGATCAPCPFTDPAGPNCPITCPPGWGFLSRNGCPTCVCAPPVECVPDSPPMPGAPCGMDPTMDTCYPGLLADPNCHPADPGCAPTTCTAAGCQGPAPLGCFAPCDPTVPMCGTCATTSCQCVQGSWTCQVTCIDSFPLSLPCQHFP